MIFTRSGAHTTILWTKYSWRVLFYRLNLLAFLGEENLSNAEYDDALMSGIRRKHLALRKLCNPIKLIGFVVATELIVLLTIADLVIGLVSGMFGLIVGVILTGIVDLLSEVPIIGSLMKVLLGLVMVLLTLSSLLLSWFWHAAQSLVVVVFNGLISPINGFIMPIYETFKTRPILTVGFVLTLLPLQHPEKSPREKAQQQEAAKKATLPVKRLHLKKQLT